MSSIFDEAGKSPKKKKKRIKAPEESPAEKEDLKELFDRIYSYHDEVEKKLEKAYELTGFDPKEVEKMIENPDNFPPQAYEIVQRRKKELIDEVEGLVGGTKTLKKKKKKKKRDESDRKRKGKTLGARKKWLQM